MIIYTAVPLEAVMEGVESYKPEYMELDYPGGGKMLIEPITPTEGRLVRLISPRPEDYLRPENQPGTIISFKPYRK